MARADIYGGETKKEGKLKRFYRWICIPFRRRSNSYIEPSPSVSVDVGEDLPQPHFTNITGPYETACKNKPIVHHYEEPEDARYTRGRYRYTRPLHPASHPPSQRPSTHENHVTFVAAQNYGFLSRDETQSPVYDAPHPNSGKRSRSRTEKNGDLPSSLRVQPPPLTKASLEMNERRNSASSYRLVDNIPDPPALQVRRWSNSSRGSIHTDVRSQHSRTDQRVRGDSNTRRPRSSFDGFQYPQVRRSSATRETPRGPRPHRPATGGSLPTRPNIVPLRDDRERVLVHSKSRGFKIVRNLLSLDAMRDMANYQHDQLRHVSSVERMAHEDQQVSQELSSITAVIAANQQRIPVAHRLYAS